MWIPIQRKALRIEVDTSIRGTRVTEILSQIAGLRGLPENIIVDNGPEFISNAMDAWAYERAVKLHFIRPGKPVDNAYIESFNGRFREECLNQHWFMSLLHARTIIEEWRNDYNLQRPHTSLKGLTPYEFAGLAENRGLEYSNYRLHNNWGELHITGYFPDQQPWFPLDHHIASFPNHCFECKKQYRLSCTPLWLWYL